MRTKHTHERAAEGRAKQWRRSRDARRLRVDELKLATIGGATVRERHTHRARAQYRRRRAENKLCALLRCRHACESGAAGEERAAVGARKGALESGSEPREAVVGGHEALARDAHKRATVERATKRRELRRAARLVREGDARLGEVEHVGRKLDGDDTVDKRWWRHAAHALSREQRAGHFGRVEAAARPRVERAKRIELVELRRGEEDDGALHAAARRGREHMRVRRVPVAQGVSASHWQRVLEQREVVLSRLCRRLRGCHALEACRRAIRGDDIDAAKAAAHILPGDKAPALHAQARATEHGTEAGYERQVREPRHVFEGNGAAVDGLCVNERHRDRPRSG